MFSYFKYVHSTRISIVRANAKVMTIKTKKNSTKSHLRFGFHLEKKKKTPVARRRVFCWARDRFENLELRPFAYNAGGVNAIRRRAENETDAAVLAEHGGGNVFPLYFSDLAENGNYLEPEEIAVRKGVCGDPRLVRILKENQKIAKKKDRTSPHYDGSIRSPCNYVLLVRPSRKIPQQLRRVLSTPRAQNPGQTASLFLSLAPLFWSLVV